MVIYSGLWMKVVAFGLISLTIAYVNCTETVSLLPPVADTKEFTSITLTCSYNGPETALHSHWLNYTYGKTEAFIGLNNNKCIATGFLNDTNNYSWSCNGNSSFSVTIKKVVRTQHGEKWRCRHLFTASKNITILVQVPVTNVKLNDPVENVVTVMENESINFMCNTSYCRPPANIEWLMCPNNCSVDEAVNISIGAENLDITNSIGFSSAISDLDYRLDRSENGWTIHCSASNLIANEVVSRKIKLNVMYPPIGPPVIHGVSHHNTYRVIENNQGFLSCSMTGGNPLPDLVWICFESDSTEVTNDTTITTSISWKAKRGQNKSCECRSEHIGGNQSVNVYLDVLYPPEKPILMISSVRVNKTVNKIINTSLVIHCKSRSNPAPDYIWTMPDSTTSKGDEVNIIQITMSNNGTYYCRAENTMISSSGKEEIGLSETSIDILILFPPTTPQLRYGNINGPIIDAGSLVVVKNDTFDIACSSSGNPEPDIIWNNKSHNSAILKISSIMSNMSVTCHAKNTMNEFGESHKGTAEAILPIMVLYPPNIPDIKYSNIQGHTTNCTSVQRHLNVNENATFSLICNATARPKASYSWYGEVTSTSSILTIHKVSRYLKGNYSCHAFNTMVRSFGEIERGTNPPDIGQLLNRTVTEGSSVNIPCPVRPGNPPETNVTWTRNLDETVWKSKELYIISTKRQDDMIYKCTAYNTMKPSCGNEIKGQASRSFHLKVVYKATVENFYANGHKGLNPVTVNENDQLEFICHTQSNPNSSLSIVFKGKTIISQPDVNKLTFTFEKASCIHDGVYTCFGSNVYNNGEASRKHLTLHVTCFPRPSPNVYLRDKVFTTNLKTVTLSFTASAYPLPEQSGFMWQKQIGLMWTPLIKSRHIRIVTSGLQSNLTISKVSKSDFGKYRLFVENVIGIYEQTFYLLEAAPPATPTEFINIDDELTNTRATVSWKPGINYDQEQWFLLQYKGETDKQWFSINITDNGALVMNYTITGLLSGAWYKVYIFAISKLGRSDNVSVNFQTKDKPLAPKEVEVIQESITETSVFVQWQPGNDGGERQTFILKYRTLTSNEWTNISILDTDTVDQFRKHYIYGLNRGSSYQLYLRSINKIGSSNKSNTVTFQTKSIASENPEGKQPVLTWVLTGLLATLTVAVVTSISVFLFKKKTARGRIKETNKIIQEDTKTGRTSFRSFKEVSGTELLPMSITELEKYNEQVKGNASYSNLALYEDIQIPLSDRSISKKESDGYEEPVSKKDTKRKPEHEIEDRGPLSIQTARKGNYEKIKKKGGADNEYRRIKESTKYEDNQLPDTKDYINLEV